MKPKPVVLLKLIDFDTVEFYETGQRVHHIMGTNQYIAPESYNGRSSPASDMWALGTTCFTLITGRFPFHAALFDDKPGENFVGHDKMERIQRRIRLARIDWSNKSWQWNLHAKNFCRDCLTYDENKRMTLDQALRHKWLTTDETGHEDQYSGKSNSMTAISSGYTDSHSVTPSVGSRGNESTLGSPRSEGKEQ
jgi:serine/threonine protein kinase